VEGAGGLFTGIWVLTKPARGLEIDWEFKLKKYGIYSSNRGKTECGKEHFL